MLRLEGAAVEPPARVRGDGEDVDADAVAAAPCGVPRPKYLCGDGRDDSTAEPPPTEAATAARVLFAFALLVAAFTAWATVVTLALTGLPSCKATMRGEATYLHHGKQIHHH